MHGKDAPNVFEINWAKQYPNCERYKKMWGDARVAWKVRDCTKQWNYNAKRVPHVPLPDMTTRARKGR